MWASGSGTWWGPAALGDSGQVGPALLFEGERMSTGAAVVAVNDDHGRRRRVGVMWLDGRDLARIAEPVGVVDLPFLHERPKVTDLPLIGRRAVDIVRTSVFLSVCYLPCTCT